MIKNMTELKQAFIFAAGRGERMKPITDKIPKPLIKIRDKSIIDYSIEKLDKITSIEKIIINGFYLSDQILEHIKKLNNPKIIFSQELEKIETGGGLVYAINKIDLESPLLTINGDVLWEEKGLESDIEKLMKNWNSEEHDILLGLKKVNDLIGYEGSINGSGDFEIIGSKLYRFPDRSMSYVYVGLQIINPKILQNPPSKSFSMSYFYKSAVGEGGLVHRISGIELDSKYFHIGTPTAIHLAENELSF